MDSKLIIPIVGFIIVTCIGMIFWPERSISHDPGVLCPDQPLQEEIRDVPDWERDGYTFTALAGFSIRALVLHRKEYSDRGADVSPVDLAVGWGAMSDQSIVDQFDISQTSRFYLWRTRHLPIPVDQITCSSTNIHLIPGNEAVRAALSDVCRGSIVLMNGYLVRVSGSDGFGWTSSLSRTDSGNHACELLWVDALEVEE